VSEATLPEVAGEESGLELAPAETTFSDIEALPDRLKGMATYVAEAAPSAAETMGQPAESGQITAEQPVTEQPALGQPVPEQPISEQAVSEQPVLEQPVLEQPVPEQAISEQPVLEQPVLEQPVPGQPVSERPVLEQPVLEQPVPEQVISEQPILEQPVLEQPVLEQPVPEQVISEQPVPEQPVPEQPVLEQPISEQAVAEQPVPEQPVPEQPIPEQPFSEQAVTEQPVLEQPFPEQPIPEQTVIEQPIPEQPLPEQPIRSESAAQEEVKPMISEPAGNPLETLPPETVGVLSVGPSPSTSGQPIEEAIPVQAEVPPPSESPVKTVTKKVVQPEMEEEDWVKGLETPTTLGETSKTDDDSLGWLRGLETPATPVYTPKVRKDSSKRRRHPISPEELESVSEPETSTWGDENIPVTGQTIPTLPEEWVPAEAKLDAGLKPAPIPETAPVEENLPPAGYEPPSETIPVSKSKQAVKSEPVTKPASIPVQRPTHPTTWKQTGKFSDVPAKDKDAELLSSAQTYLDQKSLNESMDQYSKLIKKGHLLDEVIYDLREGIHRYPVDVNIWQTLGDAYMRANRLQDALDAYTKAEELLR
jgi:hypothetical protein